MKLAHKIDGIMMDSLNKWCWNNCYVFEKTETRFPVSYQITNKFQDNQRNKCKKYNDKRTRKDRLGEYIYLIRHGLAMYEMMATS